MDEGKPSLFNCTQVEKSLKQGSKIIGKAPNLRKPESCHNCNHNKAGYISIVCDIHPVKAACYSTELLCDDHTSKTDFTCTNMLVLPIS